MSWDEYMKQHGQEEYASWDAAVKPLTDRINELEIQVKNWKEIVLWLADVQAATAYDTLTRKTMPKCEKTRALSICTKTLDSLRCQAPVNIRGRKAEEVIDRLQKVLEEYRDT